MSMPTAKTDMNGEHKCRSKPYASGRKRATLACHKCRSRKVRCDITINGSPCTNCSLDGIECTTSARKQIAKQSPHQQDLPADFNPKCAQGKETKIVSSAGPVTSSLEHRDTPSDFHVDDEEASQETNYQRRGPTQAKVSVIGNSLSNDQQNLTTYSDDHTGFTEFMCDTPDEWEAVKGTGRLSREKCLDTSQRPHPSNPHRSKESLASTTSESGKVTADSGTIYLLDGGQRVCSPYSSSDSLHIIGSGIGEENASPNAES